MFPMSVQADCQQTEDSEVSEEEEEEDRMASDDEPEEDEAAGSGGFQEDEPAGSGHFQEDEADAHSEPPATEGESPVPTQFKPMLTCRLRAVFEPLLLQQLLLLWVRTFFMHLSLKKP